LVNIYIYTIKISRLLNFLLWVSSWGQWAADHHRLCWYDQH